MLTSVPATVAATGTSPTDIELTKKARVPLASVVSVSVSASSLEVVSKSLPCVTVTDAAGIG